MPEEVEVLEGDEARLQCQVTMQPAGEVTWYKDDEPLTEDDRVSFERDGDEFAVVISPVDEDDDAEYKCVATNAVGTASSRTELIVEEGVTMPIVKEELQSMEVCEGDFARSGSESATTGLPM